ncbi:MAG: hypothetical protein IJZ16_09560 [Clostridia bacterium]|nr:hypothetical protein [Clostridia bacterium]
MKKFISTILAVVMVLSSMATVAFAADENFVYETGKYYVGQTPYDSFSAAVSAANGGTVIVSGTVEFGSRQGISTDLTLEGVNNATIIPSESYGAVENTTNWKGLLNLAGNITVKNITFDGSRYGLQEDRLEEDFVPVRCTSGVITLENVTILGSDRTLLNVGSSTTSATVTANGLYCEAPLKDVPRSGITKKVYADVNVVNGTLTLNSGIVNGFICEDSGWADIFTRYSGTFNKGETLSGHYTLTHKLDLFTTKEITSTVKHYAASYVNAKTKASTYVSTFTDAIADENNQAVVAAMVGEADDYTDATVIGNFVTLLTDAKSGADATYAETIQGYINTLNARIATLNGGNN